MTRLPVTNFRDATNPELLNTIRNGASSDYRSRIPEATQANQQETAETLHKFKALRNEFDQNLVNLIGTQVFRSNSWHNPLSVFKRGVLPYGSTVEEIQTDLLKARVHDWDADSLEKDVFGQERLPTATSFHTINRQDKYKVSQNEAALRRAFRSGEGLGTYVHSIVGALETSNNHDEFLQMANLLVLNYENDGYHMTQVPAVTNKETAELLLIKIRSMVETLRFMDTAYNAAGMHTSAQPDEMVVITTPEVKAHIDVQALAAAFNIAYADAPTRIVTIPAKYWPIEGAQAILTTEDFFQVWDTLTEAASIYNPDGLYTTNWLHAHGIFSMSRFVPALLFTTEEVKEQVNVPITISEVTTPVLYNPAGEVVETANRGEYAMILAEAVSSRKTIGQAVSFEIITDTTSELTYVTNTGTVAPGPDEEMAEITVRVTSVVDPSKFKEIKIPLAGDIVKLGFRRTLVPEAEGEITPPTEEGGE